MIVSCGEALIDMVPARTADGADAFQPCPGGSPFNTAVAVGRLGVPVSFLGRLSTDFFGTMLVRRLEANGVETGLIRRADQPTTLAFVKIEPGAEPRYAFYASGTADRSLSEEDLPAAFEDRVSCLQVGSISLTMEPGASAIESLIRREAGRLVVAIDPNIRPGMIRDRAAYVKRFEGWVSNAAVVKLSGADLEFIYPGLEYDAALERLLGIGGAVQARLVVMTHGAGGSTAVLGQKGGGRMRASAPGVNVSVLDTIGAGDTFHAGLLAWLEISGRMSRTGIASLTEPELASALRFANAAAALCCARRGAEPPALHELEAFLAGR